MPLKENVLKEILKRRANREEGPKEHGIPSRWWDANIRRCRNDHVSTMTLKSEELGRDACLACREPVYLTFPEDTDGPLELKDPLVVTGEDEQAWLGAETFADFTVKCPYRPCQNKWAYGLKACNECWQMRIAFGSW